MDFVLQSYDGGISDAPYHEAQAGFTYCAVGALSNINRLPSPPYTAVPTDSSPKAALTNPSLLIKWLVSRQTATISEEDELDTYGDETDTPETCHDAHSFVYQDKFVSKQGEMNYEGRPSVHFSLEWTGFNGRCNKIADTCYAFWVHGSLCVSTNPEYAPGNELRMADTATTDSQSIAASQHRISSSLAARTNCSSSTRRFWQNCWRPAGSVSLISRSCHLESVWRRRTKTSRCRVMYQ